MSEPTTDIINVELTDEQVQHLAECITRALWWHPEIKWPRRVDTLTDYDRAAMVAANAARRFLVGDYA